jgi:hypothetical protein
MTHSTDEPDPTADPEPEAALAQHATELADALEAALPQWVDRSVRRVLADQGIPVTDEVVEQIAVAGRAAQHDGGGRVRAMLAMDVDEQAGTPLAVVRSLVGYPTEVLRATGATPVARDEFSTRSFPDDAYDLSPAAFADVDPALHEPGLAWGAAKAYVHLARHRGTGDDPR